MKVEGEVYLAYEGWMGLAYYECWIFLAYEIIVLRKQLKNELPSYN